MSDNQTSESVADQAPTGSLLEMASPEADSGTKADAPAQSEPTWYYAEGVPGQGDRPDFLPEKYKSMEAAVKGYNELSSRFGAFTGAPEEYELNLIDDLKDKVAFQDDDGFFNSFKDWAREHQFSNEAFNDLLNMYSYHLVKAEDDFVNSYSEQMKKEFEALGDNRQQMVDEVTGWVKANTTEEDQEGVLALTGTAAGLKVLHKLISGNKYHRVEPAAYEKESFTTREKLRDMMKDPRFQTNQEYKEHVLKQYTDYVEKNNL